VESGSNAGTFQTVLLHLQPTAIFVSSIENIAVSSSTANSGFGYTKGRSSLRSKYERLTVSCRVAWSGRVNLFHRQILILPRNIQAYATYTTPVPRTPYPVPRTPYPVPRTPDPGPRTSSGLPGTSNLHRLPPTLSSALVSFDCFTFTHSLNRVAADRGGWVVNMLYCRISRSGGTKQLTDKHGLIQATGYPQASCHEGSDLISE
jgi:hypothetical protein